MVSCPPRPIGHQRWIDEAGLAGEWQDIIFFESSTQAFAIEHWTLMDLPRKAAIHRHV
jgi:hypothetical protein